MAGQTTRDDAASMTTSRTFNTVSSYACSAGMLTHDECGTLKRGVLAIVFATMMVSGAMIRNDNIVDTIKEENL